MWYNRLVVTLLRSPLHSLASGSTAVVSYVGRKSGKSYRTPVNYARIGNRVLITSFTKRTWWRNLTDDAAASIRIAGREYPTTTQVFTAPADVRRLMGDYLRAVPHLARHFGVGTLSNGRLNEADIDKLTAGRVMIECTLG